MIKPFDRKEWTPEMEKEFEQFSSHDYHTFPDETENTACEKHTTDKKVNDNDTEACFMSKTKLQGKSMKEHVWIGDTGASCHMANKKEGLFNIRSMDSKVVFGNGE